MPQTLSRPPFGSTTPSTQRPSQNRSVCAPSRPSRWSCPVATRRRATRALPATHVWSRTIRWPFDEISANKSRPRIKGRPEESITVRPDYGSADNGDVTQANSGPPTGMQTVLLAQSAAGRLKHPNSLFGEPFRITLVAAEPATAPYNLALLALRQGSGRTK